MCRVRPGSVRASRCTVVGNSFRACRRSTDPVHGRDRCRCVRASTGLIRWSSAGPVGGASVAPSAPPTPRCVGFRGLCRGPGSPGCPLPGGGGPMTRTAGTGSSGRCCCEPPGRHGRPLPDVQGGSVRAGRGCAAVPWLGPGPAGGPAGLCCLGCLLVVVWPGVFAAHRFSALGWWGAGARIRVCPAPQQGGLWVSTAWRGGKG